MDYGHTVLGGDGSVQSDLVIWAGWRTKATVGIFSRKIIIAKVEGERCSMQMHLPPLVVAPLRRMDHKCIEQQHGSLVKITMLFILPSAIFLSQ